MHPQLSLAVLQTVVAEIEREAAKLSEKVTEGAVERAVTEKVTDAVLETVVAEIEREAVKLSEKVTKPLSEKVTAPRRRSKARDENFIAAIRACDRRKGHPSEGSTLEHPSDPLFPSTFDVRLDSWDHTKSTFKAYCYHRATNRLGGFAFSANFGPKGLANAKAHPLGFTNSVRRALKRALPRHIGREVEFWFAVETTRGDHREHLHGGICVTPNEIPAARAAICEAVGAWAHTHCRKHQIEFENHPDDWDSSSSYENWGVYCVKRLGSTAKHVPGPLITVSRAITREAKRIHAHYRRSSREARKPSPAVSESMLMASVLDAGPSIYFRSSDPAQIRTQAHKRPQTPAGESSLPAARLERSPSRSAPVRRGGRTWELRRTLASGDRSPHLRADTGQ